MQGVLRLMRDSTTRQQSAAFSFVDIFAGIGGMRLGFESIGGQCLFTCEWNKYCQQTYRANFGDEDIAGDIRNLSPRDIPPHEVLLAGFPCQPFSIAGVSKKNALMVPHGFACEAQGTLFFELAKLIAWHKPKAFLLENVKHLVRHDQGRTFQTINSILEGELGYHVSYRILDATTWVPQHRERIFIVGFRDNSGVDLSRLCLDTCKPAPVLGDVLHPADGTEPAEPHYTHGPMATVDERYTLTEHLWDYLRAYAEKHRRLGNGFGYGLADHGDVVRTLSARYYKDGSEILIRQNDNRPRRLTPRECARIMGFDRPSESKFKIPVSDTQAYKQFGNAVVVPAVKAVAQYMRPWLC